LVGSINWLWIRTILDSQGQRDQGFDQKENMAGNSRKHAPRIRQASHSQDSDIQEKEAAQWNLLKAQG